MLTLKDRLRDLLERKGIISVSDYEYICRNAPRENGRGYKISNAERRLREMCSDDKIVPLNKFEERAIGSQTIHYYMTPEEFIAKHAGVPVERIQKDGGKFKYVYKVKGVQKVVRAKSAVSLITKIKKLNDKKGDK